MALVAKKYEVENQEEDWVHVPPLSPQPEEVDVIPTLLELMWIPHKGGTLVHVTAVKEIQCDEREWHIAWLSKM